ncbi:MAG: hypothetical protein Q8M86_03650, partial [Syntrophales bacterium]|nr:hypothetical protein [Syntrophales bacterium]
TFFLKVMAPSFSIVIPFYWVNKLSDACEISGTFARTLDGRAWSACGKRHIPGGMERRRHWPTSPGNDTDF